MAHEVFAQFEDEVADPRQPEADETFGGVNDRPEFGKNCIGRRWGACDQAHVRSRGPRLKGTAWSLLIFSELRKRLIEPRGALGTARFLRRQVLMPFGCDKEGPQVDKQLEIRCIRAVERECLDLFVQLKEHLEVLEPPEHRPRMFIIVGARQKWTTSALDR